MKIFILAALAATMLSFSNTDSQLIKTQMHLTVRDDLGNTVPAARVRLFETEQDYNKEENVVAEGGTDEKGVVKFKELKPISYYVLVEKEDKNNFGGGEQTGKLQEKRINKITVVIQ